MNVIDRVTTGLRLAGQIDELRELALGAERQAQALNGLDAGPTRAADAASDADIIEILRSTTLLLERLPLRVGDDVVEAADMLPRATAEKVPSPPDPVKTPLPRDDRQPSEAADNALVADATPPPHENPEPSEAVKELIAVRDMVALAAPTDASSAQQIIGALDRKLGKVLEKAGVVSLEDEGRLDYRYQEVLGTRPTSNPELDDVVCETVRRGYVLGDRVLRPQQVVSFRLED